MNCIKKKSLDSEKIMSELIHFYMIKIFYFIQIVLRLSKQIQTNPNFKQNDWGKLKTETKQPKTTNKLS